jgi:hypothetical protein
LNEGFVNRKYFGNVFFTNEKMIPVNIKRVLKIASLLDVELTIEDFYTFTGTIMLQNDSDGRGDYIVKWEHPIFARPTDEQLKD